MKQGRIFEYEPGTGDQRPVRPMVARAANADPVTSFQAAARVERSGRAATHRAIVLAWVREHPGQTSAEIGIHVGLERHEAARRLPELVEGGLLERGPEKTCGVSGKRAITWRATRC